MKRRWGEGWVESMNDWIYKEHQLIYLDILVLTDKFTKKALKSDLHLKDFKINEFTKYLFLSKLYNNIDNRSEKLMKIYL